MRFHSRRLASLATALVVGFAYPYVELALKCRGDGTSEACVWGRAYFPLTRWAEPFIVVPIVFGLLLLLGRLLERRGRGTTGQVK